MRITHRDRNIPVSRPYVTVGFTPRRVLASDLSLSEKVYSRYPPSVEYKRSIKTSLAFRDRMRSLSTRTRRTGRTSKNSKLFTRA